MTPRLDRFGAGEEHEEIAVISHRAHGIGVGPALVEGCFVEEHLVPL
jgi:hypothetical protein